MPPGRALTSGMAELDRLVGGILPGDNIVWETDSGAPIGRFMSSFVSACEAEKSAVVYVSFNLSPQTIMRDHASLMTAGRFTIVDCFSSGKGEGDPMFLAFHKGGGGTASPNAIHIERPADPTALQEELSRISSDRGAGARYIVDSLTGMLDLWGDEDVVLRFFGHLCPRLYNLDTVAYWLLETEAHSRRFLAQVRHITQVVIDVDVSKGLRTLTIRKAVNRKSKDFGVPQRFEIAGNGIALAAESREDRELGLLTKMGQALGSALDPNTFFEQTMRVLTDELGMIRGTLVLLDRAAGKLRIAAAHGLTAAERARGEYSVGEGVTGRVAQTGLPEVVPDVSKDARFLDRTAARRAEAGQPIAFICVPLKVDGDVVGALSVDRPFGVPATLEKDLRLLTIVASTVSQVLKINRMVHVDKEKILVRDERVLEDLKARFRLEKVAGQSEPIRKVLATAAQAAKSRATVLISGETGTGKELIANVVHYNSPRAEGPFVRVNCGALPETLLESELFGHVRGAFTGAVRDRKGRFEMADRGTLFLDEVAEMTPRLQVKLLRVLQEMTFEPVGSEKTLTVDVRVVAATNKILRDEVAAGKFREDLFYRLSVISVHLPPLRERRDDIPLLVDHFLERFNREYGKRITRLSRNVLDLLLAYAWPGNVRELENCIERVVVMSAGNALTADVLPPEIVTRKNNPPLASTSDEADLRRAATAYCSTAGDLAGAREHLLALVEEAAIRRGLALGLSQRALADALKLSRMTLRKKLRQLGLAEERNNK